ncbi:TonB-dependent receptor domain-containing protein [Orbus sasakiae]
MRKIINVKRISYAVKTSLLISVSSFAIAENSSNMDTMVITASGFEQQIKDAPATISVITKEEISTKPYRDITDAIKDLPGVNITGSGDATDISIRGMDGKYTLILVDGKKINTRETRPNSDGPGFEQGWLPPLSVIERIEVIRGPMSSLYGSDAMGGVVNVITKKVTDNWTGGIRLEATVPDNSKAKNYYNSSFAVTGPLITEVLGIQLYGQYSDRSEDKYLNGHAGQKLNSLNGKITLNATEKQTFELDFGHSKQTSSAIRGNSRSVTRKTDYMRDDRRNAFALSHTGRWDSFSSTTFVTHEDNNNVEREMRIKNSNVDTQFLIPLANNMLTVGGNYSYQELSDNNNKLKSSVTSIDRWNYSLFMEDEIRLHHQFAITTGLRFNKDENYGSQWNPKIYAVWNINDNYTLKGGYTTGYTTPSLRTAVADWGQGTGGSNYNGVIVGNPNLKPEKSKTIDIGLNYDNQEGLLATATIFYTKFKNKIQSYYICDGRPTNTKCSINGVSGFDFTKSSVNVDKADLYGLELSLKAPLFNHFLLSSNYTWTKTEQKSGANKGHALNRTPRQKLNTQLDWMPDEQWDLWAKVAYYGQEPYINSKNKAAKYPGYTFWDIGASFAVNKQAKVYVGIYNLFDKKVEDADFGKTLDGRRYWLGTEINF